MTIFPTKPVPQTTTRFDSFMGASSYQNWHERSSVTPLAATPVTNDHLTNPGV
jgi:hypothetical protein